MNTILDIENWNVDFEKIDKEDLKKQFIIKVYSDCHDLLVASDRKEQMDGNIFGITIEFSKNLEKTIMLDVEMDELELFANSILKQIEIIRWGYKKQIIEQIEMGVRV